MAIALSYLDDLSRVRIALSGHPDGTVQVQRALSGTATDPIWEGGIVRGGVALPVESGSAQLDDYDGWASDVANHYRTVPVDPPAGLLLDGTSGDYASTPDDAALDITGDIELAAWFRANAVTGTDRNLAAKHQGGGVDERSYRFDLLSDGTLRLIWTTDGTVGTAESRTSTVPIPTADLAVKVTLNVDTGTSNHNVIFYTADSLDGPWTQLGDLVSTAGTTSIYAGTAELWVGGESNTGNQPFDGVIRAVQIRNGIGGTAVATPNFADQPLNTTSFDDDAGRAWTINGDATVVGIDGPEQITPSLDGQVWLKSISWPTLNRPLYRVLDRGDDLRRPDRGAVTEIAGRSMPVATTARRSSRRFTLYAQVPDDYAAAVMDLVLAAGDVMLVHVPTDTDCPVPGGYVYIETTAQRRATTLSRFWFELPCTVVAPPSPEVVGTTLTWGTVERLYGSWTALVSAHPTWASLLATVGDPDDLVVL